MVESRIDTKPIARNTILSVPSPSMSDELHLVDVIQGLSEHSARFRCCVACLEFFATLSRRVKKVEEFRAERVDQRDGHPIWRYDSGVVRVQQFDNLSRTSIHYLPRQVGGVGFDAEQVEDVDMRPASVALPADHRVSVDVVVLRWMLREGSSEGGGD